MTPGEIHERVTAMRVLAARDLAETALRNPGAVAGRGSVLERDLANTILALLERADA